jgi:low affinity Fe/Cu permease
MNRIEVRYRFILFEDASERDLVMNTRNRLVVTFLLFTGCCVSSVAISFAQTISSKNSQQEIAVLQAQLKLMQAYQASLLSTVYWSLGITLTITIILVTYNWFVNNKMSERDRAALNQELRGVIEENSSQKFAQIEKAHQESITNTIKEYVSEISSKIDSVNKQLPDIHFKVLQSEARYWEIQKVGANELDRYLELLPIAMKMKSGANISIVLDKLLDLMKNGNFPFHTFNSDLIEFLDNLPNKYSPEVDAIKELLSKNRKS